MATTTAFDPTNPLAQVQALMSGRLDEAEAGHASALDRLRKVQTHETPVEASDTGPMWGAIAGGLSSFEPTGSTQDFSRALAGAGGMYGKELARQFKENRGDLEKGADLEFQDASKRLTALEGKYASALGASNKPGANGRWVSRQIPGTGEVMLFNSMTGQERPLSSNDSTLLKSMEDRYLKVADKAGYAGTEAVQWAKDMAAAEAANKPQTTSFQAAGAPQPALQTTTPFAPVVKPGLDREAAVKQLRAEQKNAEYNQDYPRAEEIGKAIVAMQSARDATPEELMPPAKGAAIVSGVKPMNDKRAEVKESESFGGEYGKNQAKKAERLSEMGGAARSLMGTVNVMEKLYLEHGDNIPEGALAPHIDTVKSGLQSLGVQMAGTGATDIVKAFGTEQALKARTADGNNLLPGAMSNYEDRLLQSMAPGLTMTREGRMLMIQIIKGQMQMKAELSDAAHKYIIKHKRLDAGWDDVATEIAKKNPLLDPKRIEALQRSAQILLKRGAR